MSIQGHVLSPSRFNADLVRLLRFHASQGNHPVSVRGKYVPEEGCWVVEIDAPSDDELDTLLVTFGFNEGIRLTRID